MDLAQTTNTLWSIHRSFQNEDHEAALQDDDNTHSSDDASIGEEEGLAAVPQLQLSQLPVASSRLWNIVEHLNETDADTTTCTEEDDASSTRNMIPSIHYAVGRAPTCSTSRTTESSLYRSNEDEESDNEDTDVGEEEQSDDDDDGNSNNDNNTSNNFNPIMSARILGMQSPTSLDFQPRLDDPGEPLHDTIGFSSSIVSAEGEDLLNTKPATGLSPRGDIEFQEDEPPRLKEDEALQEVQKCFDRVQLVSAAFFQSPAAIGKVEEEEETQNAASSANKSALSLLDLIHPMDPELFREDKNSPSPKHRQSSGPEIMNDSSDASLYYSAASHCSNNRSPSEVFNFDQYTIEHDKDHRASRLSSSFRSSTHKNRVLYSLSSGKRGMTLSQKLYSKSYLPPTRPALQVRVDPPAVTPDNKDNTSVSTNTSPTSGCSSEEERDQTFVSPRSHCRLTDTTLHILLVEISQKIFEIVQVDHTTRETTVGDVLSRARVQATDPLLSQQTYVSLCNANHELAAPMLPVNLMVVNETNTTNKFSPCTGSETSPRASEKMLQKYDEREQKESVDDPSMGRLLVAVPEGSSASQVRRVQKALWKHPRVQRWWKKQQRKMA